MQQHDRYRLDQLEARELFTRYDGNPILEPDAWPYPCNAVFNPAAVQLGNGETLLLARVEDRRGFSHLTVARSRDGLTGWQIDGAPTLVPSPEHPEEAWGVEDPRAVWMDAFDAYAVTYTAYSKSGPLVALALTKDFKTFTRQGTLMPPDDKNAVLFPKQIGGRWMLLHRPFSTRPDVHPAVWLSCSPDLKYWSESRVVLETRPGAWWDHVRVGVAAPPLETEEGWLLLYHGVRTTVSGDLYRVGLALLDLEEPWRVIRRAGPWMLGPHASYERIGDVPNVVFPCGLVLDAPTGQLRLYYGAADTCVAVAMAFLPELLDWLKANG